MGEARQAREAGADAIMLKKEVSRTKPLCCEAQYRVALLRCRKSQLSCCF
jgi:hypothetical protein